MNEYSSQSRVAELADVMYGEQAETLSLSGAAQTGHTGALDQLGHTLRMDGLLQHPGLTAPGRLTAEQLKALVKLAQVAAVVIAALLAIWLANSITSHGGSSSTYAAAPVQGGLAATETTAQPAAPARVVVIVLAGSRQP